MQTEPTKKLIASDSHGLLKTGLDHELTAQAGVQLPVPGEGLAEPMPGEEREPTTAELFAIEAETRR